MGGVRVEGHSGAACAAEDKRGRLKRGRAAGVRDRESTVVSCAAEKKKQKKKHLLILCVCHGLRHRGEL